ncbi:EAL domain-containing response regulator [Marinomonas balearica]|uniref:EAL domain-containing protein (Putative c-di-GMP-specific phosphodiesterase class I) n=1 Tax=Marinomonas balearica TaxID=491947 RepID=A0A4V3CGM5_9GAMM|nr:EAL domain-containing protein [Marinomonas balearica]TDO98282.1 EAL domain-containing protein (putative c-di-GMP-specific phosphodiesterase class I) [Marinomonas balearica]
MSEPRMLIVDDHDDNRYTLIRRLRRLGYPDCDEAENGQVALEMIRENTYDLVFLDLMMPVMDGFSTLRAMREEGLSDHLPIIMISAADDLENVAKGIELGAEDYLSKPFNPTLLSARTASALEKRSKAIANLNAAKYCDPASGLKNKQGLIEDLDSEASNVSAAIIFKMSKYSMVMSSYGNDIANRYFSSQAKTLRSMVDLEYPEVKEIYRFNDDLLSITLESNDSNSLVQIAHSLCRKLSGRKQVDNGALNEEVVAGVVADLDEVTSTDILQRLTSSLAQTCSNAPVALYDSEHTSQALRRIRVEADLKDAIDQQLLEVFFQPQVNVSTKEVVAAEALVRWKHTELGMISPGEFIPIAEENGMIVALGEVVFIKTLKTLKTLDKLGCSVPISINIGSDHFLMHNFVSWCSEAVEREQVPVQFVKLELTESTLLNSVEEGVKVLSQLRSKGFKIALDDFGTGYSSLSYLLELPLDQLKIDKQFVDMLDKDKRSENLLSHLVGLAHELDLQVVVEGVENEAQVSFMEHADADLIQGFYYYKPLPQQEFVYLLSKPVN